MPFIERSEKALFKALVDAEEAMNREETRTMQLCQHMPKRAMEARRETAEVKELLRQSEVE